MDAVDRALSSVRAIDSMVGRTLAEPPWGLVLDTDAPCVLAAVLHGEAWVTHADAEPLRVGRGEIVTACGHAPLVIGHQPGAAIDVVVTDRDVCYDPVSGADLSESCRIGGRTFGRPDGSVSVLVAAFHADSEVYWLLERVLPRMLHVPATEQLARLLAVLEAETDVERPGHQVAVDRLMELLLISTVRAWLDGDGAGVPSWATALDDPVVGPALRAMHDDLAAPWTVEALARVAAVSRATFSRRFTERVGVPPMTHLTEWRMAHAADLLAVDPRRGLGEIAAAVGYADPFSFSTAFRRCRGIAPSHHRRRAPRPVPPDAVAQP